MNVHDLIQVQTWIKTYATLADVENAERVGLVENVRFSAQAKRLFTLLWYWSAPRFHGCAGQQQDRFYQKCGPAALERRIKRCQNIIQRLIC